MVVHILKGRAQGVHNPPKNVGFPDLDILNEKKRKNKFKTLNSRNSEAQFLKDVESYMKNF